MAGYLGVGAERYFNIYHSRKEDKLEAPSGGTQWSRRPQPLYHSEELNALLWWRFRPISLRSRQEQWLGH